MGLSRLWLTFTAITNREFAFSLFPPNLVARASANPNHSLGKNLIQTTDIMRLFV